MSPEADQTIDEHAAEARLRRLSLAMLMGGLATFALLYAVQPLMPLLASSFGVSPGASTLTLAVSTGMVAICLLPAGMLSGRFGRTRVMTGSVLGASVLGLACAVAPNLAVLVILRAAQGAALAGLPAVAMAYLTEEIPAGSLGRAMGLYIAGNAIGGMLGRLLAGGLADVGGWRLAIAGIGLISLACAVAFARMLPSSQNFTPEATDWRILAARVRETAREPGLLRLYGEGALLMGTFVAVYNALGFRLQAAPYHLSQTALAAVFLVYPIGSAGSSLAGRLADTVGRRVVLPCAIALALAGLALTGAHALGLVMCGIALLTVGFFAGHSVASSWIGRRARHSAAEASALYLMAYYLGSTIAGPAGGVAWSHGGWSTVGALAALMLALALVLALRLRRTPPLAAAAVLAEA